MPRSSFRGRGSLTPEQRAQNVASNQAHAEFWKLPGGGRPATTTGPSIRNAVHNVKSLPGDFAQLGRKIGSGFKTVVSNIKNPPQGTAGKYGRGMRGPRGGAMNKALQSRMK